MIQCPTCYTPMQWIDNHYVCSNCGGKIVIKRRLCETHASYVASTPSERLAHLQQAPPSPRPPK